MKTPAWDKPYLAAFQQSRATVPWKPPALVHQPRLHFFWVQRFISILSFTAPLLFFTVKRKAFCMLSRLSSVSVDGQKLTSALFAFFDTKGSHVCSSWSFNFTLVFHPPHPVLDPFPVKHGWSWRDSGTPVPSPYRWHRLYGGQSPPLNQKMMPDFNLQKYRAILSKG